MLIYAVPRSEMPTRAALLDAGRPDLINLIIKVGGFTQVWSHIVR
jgi:hypothetical protein